MINFHLYVVEPTLAHQTVYTVPVCLLQNTKKDYAHLLYDQYGHTHWWIKRGCAYLQFSTRGYYAHISVNLMSQLFFFLFHLNHMNVFT